MEEGSKVPAGDIPKEEWGERLPQYKQKTTFPEDEVYVESEYIKKQKSRYLKENNSNSSPKIKDEVPFFGYIKKSEEEEGEVDDNLEEPYLKKELRKMKLEKPKKILEEEEIFEEEDLLCAVCVTVRSQNTAILVECGHKFCTSCLLSSKDNRCPVCRTPFDPVDDVFEDSAYKKNYSVIQVRLKENGKELILSAEDLRKRTSVGLNDDSISKFKPNMDMIPKKNLLTFACPCCKMKHLDRGGLLDHVSLLHPQERAVCPICAIQSYGDPSFKTHLSGHLRVRHSYDMNDLVDDEEDEETVLQRIIELSKIIK